MVNRFVLNAVSYHGKGAIKEIPGLVQAKGLKKPFIASDPDLIKFGVTKKVTDLLDEAGMAYEIYSDIKPNPTIENIQSGADYMITIGGGSSMDTGKAIGIIINNPEFADVRSLEGTAPIKNRTVYTIAVPTTAGTAAEATINYVSMDVERKRKFVCVDTNDIPNIAVVDPDMMSSMPKGLTAATGMDQAAYRKAAIEAVRQLSVDVGIPTKLEALKEEDLDFLAESAYADACRPGNPKDTCVEYLKALLRKLM